VAPTSTSAQSFNIDFGGAPSAPSSSYAAIGLPGVWNSFDDLPTSERFPLVGLNGAMTAARIYNIGGVSILNVDHPGTSGDDEALVDDMFIGFNDPVDVCLFFEGLANGDYLVITYAITPDDPLLLSRVRVDEGSPGPVMIGGDWPESHRQGVTFARHEVTVSDGRIGLHSGLWDGDIQSGVNGLQLVHLSTVGVAGPAATPLLAHLPPNPSRISEGLLIATNGAALVSILDARGRLLFRGHSLGLDAPVRWDGTTAGGRRAAPGVYVLRVAGRDRVESHRLVRLE
jgi:hypothetical protein